MNNKIIYFVGCGIPVYSCNFRCKYCYLEQHSDPYTKGIIKFAQSPSYISKFFDREKLGGLCYFNMCASGETLLHPEIIELVNLLTKQGHFVDIITNGTLKKKFEDLISLLDYEQRKHLMIKFSFHYLELKRTGMLEDYVSNVHIVKASGISFSIEITPHDELIPYIEEIKQFSIKNFGALPHITVARNEATTNIELLTKLLRDEYKKVWSVFESKMFDFKFSIFSVRRYEFCYAGLWSLQLSLESGEYYQCYGGDLLGNIKDGKLKLKAIGSCRQPHCFNGHAYLTYGNIPELDSPVYTDMRDRICLDGTHWIQEECRDFFSTKLIDNHTELSESEKNRIKRCSYLDRVLNRLKRGIIHLPNRIKG